MLQLLLDEHLSPKLVRQFLARQPRRRIASVLEWEGGKCAGMPDALVQAEAHRLGWMLVTYDQATIPPVLKAWAADGVDHGGVVFLDDRRFPQRGAGTVLKALLHVWDRERNRDWVNQVVYLDRASEA
jgi:hypothetical protein